MIIHGGVGVRFRYQLHGQVFARITGYPVRLTCHSLYTLSLVMVFQQKKVSQFKACYPRKRCKKLPRFDHPEFNCFEIFTLQRRWTGHE